MITAIVATLVAAAPASSATADVISGRADTHARSGQGAAGAAGKPPKPTLKQSTMMLSPELGGRSEAALAKPPSQPMPLSAPTPPVEAKPLPPPSDSSDSKDDHALEVTQGEAPGRDVMPENAAPIGLLARRTRLPKELEGSAIILPFSPTTGAAVFQRSTATYVVFDERRPVDMSALQDDRIFGSTDVQLLPNGTVVRLPLPNGISIALSQTAQGWRIAGLKAIAKSQPIVSSLVNGVMNFAVEQSSDVISMADPDGGATLLIGTTRKANQAVAIGRRTTEFILPPTSLGVVVEPLSDAIALKLVPIGFTLSGHPDGLAMSPATAETDALMDAAHLTRRLEFSNMPTDALMRRMINQSLDAAMAPPQAKGAKRQAAAQSMIALGLDAEAESLLNMAAEQDPKEAASADVTGLTAIAALLAGRISETDGLNDQRLTGTDDIALWRAVRQAMQDEGSPAAAAVFASTAPLALLYPKPISDRITPLIIETMIEGGEIQPAARLLARHKNDTRLNYARALQQQAEGDTDQALALLDALTDGHDQFDRARASVRAVELRLSTHKISPAQAADALDKLVYAWRGDARELALRERIAELRGQAGTWRVALSTLRQTEADFPEQAAAIHAHLKEAFASMVSGRGLEQMTPIDVVSAIDENADLIPSKDGDPVLEEQLANRLLALDLPERAKPVLEKLMKSAASASSKARFGATLAALQSREKDDAGALASLDASDSRELPPDLVENRAVLRANAMAHTGHPAAAAAVLAGFATPVATEARATILEQAQDWPGAEAAWSTYAATALPESGQLNDTQGRTLLRLTTAAARAGDDGTLASLREKYDNRLTPGALTDMFRLLSAQPVRGTSDLQRARQEVSLAQSLPANLKALDAPTAAH